MERETKSTPNNKIAIICKRSDNENNTFTIIPISVAVGKVDEKLTFHSENGEYHLNPIDRIENITDESQEFFYIYCDDINNLTKIYNEKDINKVMMQYYMEIASHFNLALVDGDEIYVYNQEYENISPEIKGNICKHYEKPTDTPKTVNINKKNYLPTEVDLEHINAEDLANYLKKHIFENDSILDNIATVIAMNYSAKKRQEIVSMLSIGTSGSGKSETYRLISEYLGVPFTIFDCSCMSATGYQGDSVSDLIRTIYQNGKDKEILIPKSIVVLEEIDKIASRGHGVTDSNVQFELLKFLDGHTYSVNADKVFNNGKEIKIDTTFMTKAGLGAFEELFEKKKKEARGLGFNSGTNKPLKIEDKDLIDYGMIRQIVRRFIHTFQYKDLAHDDLKRILLYSLISPLLIKKERYKRDFNTVLEYTADYIDAVVDYATILNEGAGGLNKAVNKSLIKVEGYLCTHANSNNTPKQLRITAETVENPCKFTC